MNLFSENNSSRVAVSFENAVPDAKYQVELGAHLGFAIGVTTQLKRGNGEEETVKAMVFQPEEASANQEFLVLPHGGPVMVRIENDIHPGGTIDWEITGLVCTGISIIYPGNSI